MVERGAVRRQGVGVDDVEEGVSRFGVPCGCDVFRFGLGEEEALVQPLEDGRRIRNAGVHAELEAVHVLRQVLEDVADCR